jgi:hypothetical protein
MKNINLIIAGAWAILGICISYCASSHAGVSFTEARQVFGQLYNISGQHSKLHYNASLEINAWNSSKGQGYEVVITKGMLSTLRNKDELAMVLGHELGHKALHHWRPKFHPRQEMDADDVGYYYCKKLGYKRCVGALKALQQKLGNRSNDGIHPPWDVRIKGVLRHE